MPGVLLDAGPLVAYLHRRDAYHAWAVEQFEAADTPFITCEAVLTESCFLTARNGQPPTRVVDMIARGAVRIGLGIEDEAAAIHALMERYADIPMSLADACLVRLAELTGLPVCTLDADFITYRAHRRRPLEVISPGPSRALHEP